jgi:hypothetical protein
VRLSRLPLPTPLIEGYFWVLVFGDLKLTARVYVCAFAAAQFLSRVIPFLYNGWFVRKLSADDCAVRISPAPIFLFQFSAVGNRFGDFVA